MQGSSGVAIHMKRSAAERRAQAGLEYMIAFSLALIVFVMVQVYAIEGRNNALEERTGFFAKLLTQDFAQTAYVASAAPGTRITFLIPAGLGEQGLPYFLRVNNETVSVEWQSSNRLRTAQAALRIARIRNESGAASFNITGGGYYFINNTEGTVYVTKAFD